MRRCMWLPSASLTAPPLQQPSINGCLMQLLLCLCWSCSSFGQVDSASRSGMEHASFHVVLGFILIKDGYAHAAIRRPLYKTLVHGLRDINPQAAVTLEAAPRLRNPSKANTAERVAKTVNSVSDFTFCMPHGCMPRSLQRRALVLGLASTRPSSSPRAPVQVMQLLAVDILLYIWHKLPVVGHVAGPLMQFLSVRDSLGTHRAAALSILGPLAGLLVWRPLEHWCFQFVRLWRASRVTPCNVGLGQY